MAIEKKVLVLNAYGTNLGDQAIYVGFINSFLPVAMRHGLDVTIVQKFIYEFPIRETNIDEINSEYDLIVIGGGGVIFNRPRSNSSSGWGFDIPLDLLEKLKVPYVVYAVGYNYRPYSKQRFQEGTGRHIQEVAKNAALFSMREFESMEILRNEMGVTTPIEFLPDPAMHVPVQEVVIPQLDPYKKTIGVCLRMDELDERFPPPGDVHFQRFIEAMVEALRILTLQHGFQVLHLPHLNMPQDHFVDKVFKKLLPDNVFFSLFELFPKMITKVAFENPKKLMSIYKQMDVVLGKRLHSNIMPFAVETPVVAISSTQSNLWMLKLFGCEEYHIDICDFDRQVTGQNISDRVLKAVSCSDDIRQLFREKKQAFVQVATHHAETMVQLLLNKT